MNSHELIAALNGTFLFAFAALSFWIAMDERFETRVIMTTGLSITAIGAAVTAAWELNGLQCEDLDAINRGQALMHLGMAIVIVGYAVRAYSHRGEPRRRKSDFMQLDEIEHREVSGGKQ